MLDAAKVTGKRVQRASAGALATVAVMVLTVGCAPLRLPAYSAGPPSSYPIRQASGELQVAVHPMTDIAEQQKYFGLALGDLGVLPVLIVVENRSSSAKLVLRDDRIALQSLGTQRYYPKLAPDMAMDAKGNEGAQSAAVGVGVASLYTGPMILSLPAVLYSVKLGKDSETAALVQTNLLEKSLLSRIIRPGTTVSGFAYFKLAEGKLQFADKGGVQLSDIALALQLTDEEKNETQTVSLRLR
jgi:hypothetical protein